MIKFMRAPRGYIAQFFTDGPDEKFLGVSGRWCSTLEGAIQSAIQSAKKQPRKELEKQIRTQKERVSDLSGVSESVVQNFFF